MKNVTQQFNHFRRGTLLASILMPAVLGMALTACSDVRGEEGDSMADSQKTHEHAPAAAGAGAAHGAHSQTPPTRLEFASAPATILSGATTTLRLRIVDTESGQPVPEFDLSHEKLMHLIVVSKDLTWFNHVHPRYVGNGEFVIDLELPRGGDYKLYADYTPSGGSQTVMQHEFSAAGSPGLAPAELVTDRTAGDGWMIHTTVSRPEGEPDAVGSDEYQVAMMPMPSKIMAGKDVMIHFQVRDAQGKPVEDLEPYLGASGHAVLLSGDTRTYLHTHPMDHGTGNQDSHEGHGGHGGGGSHGSHDHHGAPPAAGSDVMFHTNFPAAGLYKVWGQFQHKGKIITEAFVLRVN